MGLKQNLKQIAREMFRFTERERRGILWLIPIGIVVSLLIAALARPRFEQSLQVAADMTSAPSFSQPAGDDGAVYETELFEFDPNTITYKELRTLGFSSRAAAGIVKYRASGKVFRVPEEFAACWDVGDSIFYALERYIVIAPEYAAGKRPASTRSYSDPAPATATHSREKHPDTLFVFDPNTASAEDFRLLGFSPRQAEVIIARREQIKGFRSADEFSECYVVSPEQFKRLKPHIRIAIPERKIPSKVELNSADSVALIGVSGIGALTASRILALRRALGGFVRAEQLSEVKGMTEQNYERILQQIFVDDSKIQKIDINFATPQQIAGHPYITSEMLRKIVKNRQLKGGWSTPENMIDDGTLTAMQAARLGPYLKFTPVSNK